MVLFGGKLVDISFPLWPANRPSRTRDDPTEPRRHPHSDLFSSQVPRQGKQPRLRLRRYVRMELFSLLYSGLTPADAWTLTGLALRIRSTLTYPLCPFYRGLLRACRRCFAQGQVTASSLTATYISCRHVPRKDQPIFRRKLDAHTPISQIGL